MSKIKHPQCYDPLCAEHNPGRSDQPQCEHVYSKSMNQPYPRHCVKCGKIEGTPPQRSEQEQEWTAEYVEKLAGDYGWAGVSHNHNVALAAERETKEKAIEAWGNRNLKLAKQLAAEERRANDSIEENVRLMERLAEERSKVKKFNQRQERR